MYKASFDVKHQRICFQIETWRPKSRDTFRPKHQVQSQNKIISGEACVFLTIHLFIDLRSEFQVETAVKVAKQPIRRNFRKTTASKSVDNKSCSTNFFGESPFCMVLSLVGLLTSNIKYYKFPDLPALTAFPHIRPTGIIISHSLKMPVL